MAAQSGIQSSERLTEAWSTALSTPTTRLVKIIIEKEVLEPAHVLEERDSSLEAQFGLFDDEGVVEDKVPAYYLLRLEPSPTSAWLFYSFVPDSAPVRSKMLYASTRATLGRALGEARFSSSIFATSRNDLTHDAYLSHTRHESSSAPLTAREQEMADIRQAEQQRQRDGNEDEWQAQSMVEGPSGGNAKLPAASMAWDDEAREAMESLGRGERRLVQLEIDTAAERVILTKPQPDSLSLPPASPCYAFYRHDAGLVVIYSCPSKSPIKSRMIYASSVRNIIMLASQMGVEVVKKLETSEPDEVTDAFIANELGIAAASEAASGSSTPGASGGGDKPAFARPSRPGRKR